MCRDAVGGDLPQMFATAKTPRVGKHRAGVRVLCTSAQRCIGRLVLRDKHGRLGTRTLNIGAHKTRAVRVHLSRTPARRVTAKVLTFQPGGYVIASLSYTLGG